MKCREDAFLLSVTRSKGALRLTARLGFFITMAAVALMSLLPQQDIPRVDVSDKAEHFAAYAILAVLGAFGFLGRRTWLWLLLFLPTFGAVMELLQAFSPGRSPDIADAATNMVGVMVGLLVAAAARRSVRP